MITLGGYSFANCHIGVFESIILLFNYHYLISHLIILDLPQLHTISLRGDFNALGGDINDNRAAMINGYESYDNTLIMKSMLK